MTEPKLKLAKLFPPSRRGFYRMLGIKAILVGAIAFADARIDHPGIAVASCIVAIAIEAANDWEMQRLREELEKRRRNRKE